MQGLSSLDANLQTTAQDDQTIASRLVWSVWSVSSGARRQGAPLPRHLVLPCLYLTGLCIGLSSCASRVHAPAGEVADASVPTPFQPFIDRMSAPVELMELPDYIKGDIPDRITKPQALEDIEVLRYLLDNAYSGRFYWQQQGVDFAGGYAALRRHVEEAATPDIDTREFERQIHEAFKGINDPHTAIMGHEVTEFFTRVRQYFASFVVAKEGDRYLVVQSAVPDVPVGSEYVDAEANLFPTLAPAGSQQYLVGGMSTTPREQMTVRFRHGVVTVAMHPSRIGNIRYDRFNDIIDVATVRGIPVIRSSSFWVDGKIKDLEDFAEHGKQLRDEPFIVWNLLANDGGITTYPAQFIEHFNGIAQERSWEAHLHSTPIAQAYFPGKNGWSSWPAAWLDDATPMSEIPEYKHAHIEEVRQEKVDLIANPRRFWVVVREAGEQAMGDYRGRLVVLSNYRNGSAGNNALAMSKSVPNSVIVGENSNMTYAFANTRMFSLKHSRIKLRLPGRLIIHPENSIERGFLPDFWLDSETPVEEVTKWLLDPAGYQFKYHD
jgi:hypothetical protein